MDKFGLTASRPMAQTPLKEGGFLVDPSPDTGQIERIAVAATGLCVVIAGIQ